MHNAYVPIALAVRYLVSLLTDMFGSWDSDGLSIISLSGIGFLLADLLNYLEWSKISITFYKYF